MTQSGGDGLRCRRTSVVPAAPPENRQTDDDGNASAPVTSALLWLLFASSFAVGDAKQGAVPRSTAREMTKLQASRDHLTADDTILDLLNHRASAGFSRLLLP